MEAIREVVSGNALSAIIQLPKSLRNRQVEIIVLPATETTEADKPFLKISKNELLELKKSSSAVKLTGMISHPPITMAEIRAERLAERYGSID